MPTLRSYQPAFTAGELSPALHARVDLAKYQTGLKVCENFFIHPHGGASNRAGFEFVYEVKASANATRLIPFQFNTEQTYVLEFGNTYFRVFRDGGLILSGGSPYEVTTPYLTAELDELVFAQEADVMYFAHTNHPPYKLSRIADDNWTFAAVTFTPSIATPATPTVTALVGSGSTTYRYKVAAIDNETGEESLPSAIGSTTNDLTIAGNKNRIAFTAVTGAVRYIIYKEDNGVYGYIGGTEGLTFDDENIASDLADTPQVARNPFSATDDYPRCVTFFEQRLAFASTNNDPQAFWLSQTANYENFGYASPAKASDAVTFRVRANQVNEVRGMIPMRGLLALTSGAEWLASGGASDAITPSSIKIEPQSYRGASIIQPIVVGNTVLFAQDRGGVIRDFSYQFTDDSFVGRDITILARHMFENKNIKSWAYAQASQSIVWVVLDDGTLASLTYMREHEVWAWTRHVSGPGNDAYFEDVIVVAEGGEDVPYFIIKRTVDSSSVRYIERLHTRHFSGVEDAFFVDSGLTYDGAAATVISGLDHLEGESVVALADGNVVKNLTVSSGAVTLPNAAEKVHVGLPYDARLQTLDLDLGAVKGLGTVQGRTKSVPEVTLRVEDTRGIWVGPDENNLIEYKQRATEAWNEATSLYTGDLTITPPWDWNDGANMWVKQIDPLPITVLALMPDVQLGR